MTKIICAFAGTGKTTAAKSNLWRARDSDSDEFRFINARLNRKPEGQNPLWPQNFIDHAVTEFDKGDFDAILMSAYVEHLPAIGARVPLTYVYPSLDMKDEFEARYRCRGNSQGFIDLLIGNFDTWITALMTMKGDHVVLKPGQYLTDVLPNILARP
ncbi:MAG: Serratia phage [Candidatus Parcubacteria bacterium]|jgi:hypothetical protein